jgi:hypothetical protein|tara:strand:+ start:86607 stop:86795 length:189 start_codon:yes stop_codon:yes gene_type:complete
MAFIDLEDKHPTKQGIYRVKIQQSTGGHRESRASWNERRGFLPLDDALGPEEYIFAWEKIQQ